MIAGRIVKGIGGFYTVRLDDGTDAVCKARGRFRRDGIVPMIGDRVNVLPQRDGNCAIEEILPRRNALIRPPVANIDRLVITVAASAPQPDWLLVDKLILSAMRIGIEPLLVLNKIDDADPEIVDAFQTDYSAFDRLMVSTKTGEGIDRLREILSNAVSSFAGQSAVGKSSLINALMPELELETGGLTRKTDRGKHTTRHAELWPFLNGALLDTPGFSLLNTDDIDQAELDRCYPEFGDAPQYCRFPSCSHISEPDCAVKPLLASNRLSPGRYARYQILSDEIKQRRKHRYD